MSILTTIAEKESAGEQKNERIWKQRKFNASQY